MKIEHRNFTAEDLSALVGMTRRTIRFYIQRGLVSRPQGTGKGAFYTHQHLEELLTIRKWKDAGLTLERIQELLRGETALDRPVPPPRRRKKGQVEVWSKLFIQDGVELHIEPGRAGFTPEEIRRAHEGVLAVFSFIRDLETQGTQQ